MVWKMIFLFQACILKFHVKLHRDIHQITRVPWLITLLTCRTWKKLRVPPNSCCSTAFWLRNSTNQEILEPTEMLVFFRIRIYIQVIRLLGKHYCNLSVPVSYHIIISLTIKGVQYPHAYTYLEAKVTPAVFWIGVEKTLFGGAK